MCGRGWFVGLRVERSKTQSVPLWSARTQYHDLERSRWLGFLSLVARRLVMA